MSSDLSASINLFIYLKLELETQFLTSQIELFD